MNKSELRTGMLVKHRNGDFEMVFLAGAYGDILVGHTGARMWELGCFDEERLSHFDGYRGWDIIAVYQNANPNNVFSFDINDYNLIWKRKLEIKEVTMADIEKKFGCKVKIVKGEG